MSRAYYNEIDPYAARWLRNLIAAGLIAPGDVDERSIADVRADDLIGYDQCHFFAGIGGWSYALRLAGWDGPAWTGSCPCQPLSSAGQRKGHADERHLWPAFHSLIAERRPATVFGEQVASKDGREWLAGVRADLERLGYAVGAADLCAAGVGAPHIRQRLFWGADTDQTDSAAGCGGEENPSAVERSSSNGGLGDPCTPGLPAPEREGMGGSWRRQEGRAAAEPGLSPAFWSGADWLPCLDGKARRVEPGVFPLAHGVSGRVGRLRAYGNAIVPQIAAEFVSAFMETAAIGRSH